MKNMFGDETEPRKLEFKWLVPTLQIHIDGHWSGMVVPNGYLGTGYMNIHHKFGEPILSNVDLLHDLSFSEMQQIMDAFNTECSAMRSTQISICQFASYKNMTFVQALAYLKEKKIPLYCAEVVGP